MQARLTRVGGLACSRTVDPRMLNLLVRCDGTRRLGDVLRELSASLPGDSRSISSVHLHAVRTLIASGMLLAGVPDSADRECAAESTDPKVMVLMRGLPSCGKTTKARQLAAKGGLLIEFDEYFYTQVGNDASRYDWSYDLIPQARQWNLDRILSAIDAGANPTIVDSDNNACQRTKRYVAYAIDRGYEIRFEEPESPWWRAVRKLLRDKEANVGALRDWARKLAVLSKGTHGVPFEDFLRRIDRWEELTHERIMGAA